MDHRPAAAGCPRASPRRRRPPIPRGRALLPEPHTDSCSCPAATDRRAPRGATAPAGGAAAPAFGPVAAAAAAAAVGKAARPGPPPPPSPAPPPARPGPATAKARSASGRPQHRRPAAAQGCAAPAAAPARPPQNSNRRGGWWGGKNTTGGRKITPEVGKRECSQSGNSLFISQKYILSCTIWFTHMYIFTVCTKTTTTKKKKIETPNSHWTSKKPHKLS